MLLPLPAHAVIGMIHLPALPGTPASCLASSIKEVSAGAVAEARILADAGFDALIIENMHDRPYLNREVGPEIVASFTRIGAAIREAVDCPLGVQVLAGANRAALAVAQAIEAQFIRAEGFVFASVADEGLMAVADAGPLLRYRRAIGADEIAIWADIKKKHSAHAMTADVDLPATARAAEFAGADAVIVTGSETGDAVDVEGLATVQAALVPSELPVVIGSGAMPKQLPELFKYANSVIVGSYLKEDGVWSNPLDPSRLETFMEAANAARSGI